MNEPDLEKELRAFTPIAPSLALEKRIAAELAAPVPESALSVIQRNATIIPIGTPRAWQWPRFLTNLGWATCGAAAAVAVISLQPKTEPAPARPTAHPATAELTTARHFPPRQVTSELLAAQDGGIVYAEDQPVRLVRYRTLERHSWTDSTSGARLEVELPRQDLVLLPLAMQ